MGNKMVSVIIPVYRAEEQLTRCVESLIFGAYRDIEIILVEDRSPDNSWEVCQSLTGKYENVRCLQNEKNSGVSYTRNQGLTVATGDYILFVDSDDWVSGHYAERLLQAAQNHPDALVCCGFTFFNEVGNQPTKYVWDREKPAAFSEALPLTKLFDLREKTLLQPLWNKIFRRSIIEEHHIRFDEAQSMGEDLQFVLDYIGAGKIKGCFVLNEPLYGYVRWSNSLMSKIGLVERENGNKRLARMRDLCGAVDENVELQYQRALTAEKENQIYQLCRCKTMGKQEKLAAIAQIAEHGTAMQCYRRQKVLMMKESLTKTREKLRGVPSRVQGKLQRQKQDRIAKSVKKQLQEMGITIISQNCIGGVCYHDMGLPFLSPTINLYFTASDFLKFVGNLRHYLAQPLELRWEEYPVGKLGDVELHFMHYATCSDAKEKWERRAKRINWDKILVIATDRNGFHEEAYEQWKKLPYPKVLFTAQKAFAEDQDSVYFPQYSELHKVPDLISNREFYKDNVLVNKLNSFSKKGTEI